MVTVDAAAVGKRLATIPNGEWPTLLRNAINRTDSTQPDADQRFISKLGPDRRAAATTPTQTSGNDHQQTPER